MALIKCPKCGREISDKAKQCPGCGWNPIENASPEHIAEDIPANFINPSVDHSILLSGSEIKEQTELKEEQQEKVIDTSPKNNTATKYYTRASVRKSLKIVTIVFAVCAIFFLYRAYYVKNTYYNSDNSWGTHTNAYVGGDAYNYIINGTYFTGYCVIGMGCVIGAAITGSSYLKCSILEEKDEKEDGTD